MVDIETLTSVLLSLLIANISWTPPEYNNARITRYSLSLCDDIGCSTKVILNPAVPYLLLPVIPTHTYTINIIATNRVGDSVISDEGMFMGAMEGEMLCSIVYVCGCGCGGSNHTHIYMYMCVHCMYLYLHFFNAQHVSLPTPSLPPFLTYSLTLPPPSSAGDSMPTLTASLITDSVVILKWTLPPLARPCYNFESPTAESAFDVNGYFIFIKDFPDIEPVYLEGRDNTSYLFSDRTGVSPGPLTFVVNVAYSRA